MGKCKTGKCHKQSDCCDSDFNIFCQSTTDFCEDCPGEWTHGKGCTCGACFYQGCAVAPLPCGCVNRCDGGCRRRSRRDDCCKKDKCCPPVELGWGANLATPTTITAAPGASAVLLNWTYASGTFGFNNARMLNPATGVFTVAKPGKYDLEFNLIAAASVATPLIITSANLASAPYIELRQINGSNPPVTVAQFPILELATVGDVQVVNGALTRLFTKGTQLELILVVPTAFLATVSLAGTAVQNTASFVEA